jgi:hypothetical protein
MAIGVRTEQAKKIADKILGNDKKPKKNGYLRIRRPQKG